MYIATYMQIKFVKAIYLIRKIQRKILLNKISIFKIFICSVFGSRYKTIFFCYNKIIPPLYFRFVCLTFRFNFLLNSKWHLFNYWNDNDQYQIFVSNYRIMCVKCVRAAERRQTTATKINNNLAAIFDSFLIKISIFFAKTQQQKQKILFLF